MGVGGTVGTAITLGAEVPVGLGTSGIVGLGSGVCVGTGDDVGGTGVAVATGPEVSGAGCSEPQAKLIITTNATTVMDSSAVIFLMECRLSTSPLLYGAD